MYQQPQQQQQHGAYPQVYGLQQQQAQPMMASAFVAQPAQQSYGQPSYIGAGASQPQQQHAAYQQPMQQQYAQHPVYPGQPQPQPLMPPSQSASYTDPSAFAHMFKSHLASLTFNSKPIITNLTVMAMENAAMMAGVIAQCIEEHTLNAPPAYRLPAIYALDSICKNVGLPYTDIWSSRIYAIFMETYRVVDHAVKGRMEELLNTWRNSGLNGSPLFGGPAQEAIERALWGQVGPPSHLQNRQTQAQMTTPQQQPQPSSFPQRPSATPPVTNNAPVRGPQQRTKTPDVQGIVMRFDRLLTLCAHDQRANPHLFDPTRMDALTKLRTIVANTNLSPAELGQIVAQLNSLETEMQQRTPQQHMKSPVQAFGAAPAAAAVASGNFRNTPPSGIRSPIHAAQTASAIPPSLAGALASLGKFGGSSTPPLPTKTATGGALDLIASLRQAGLLPASSVEPDPDAEYCDMVKGMQLRLTITDLQREVPLGSLEAITNKELPLTCKQCAKRYPAGDKGQASLDKHLDWHFRQNRRAKDSAVRGQSRSWFSKLDEWIRGGHDDTAPARRGGDGAEGAGGGLGAALTPAQEAELKAATKAFVVAPSDDPEASTRPCPVCKEHFTSEWSEDEEEFIWKNCVKIDGVYYHGSCHYSAKTLSHSVASQLPSGSGSSTNSREGTPQTPDIKAKAELKPIVDPIARVKQEEGTATSQQTGTKRKSSEDTSVDEMHETSSSTMKSEEGTPSKRERLEGEEVGDVQVKGQ